MDHGAIRTKSPSNTAEGVLSNQPEQAVRLYQRAVEMADLTGDEIVFDLYCGIGSIALFIANQVKRVVGVEVVEDAVTAATENAALNGIDNVEFVSGEVESVLDETIDRFGVPDLVVLDPPRAGVHPAARKAIRERPPKRVVYISCNPRSQAADIADLIELYRIVAYNRSICFPKRGTSKTSRSWTGVDRAGW
jgi:23S rRNA (uracil1939-C5)-methyltransferase